MKEEKINRSELLQVRLTPQEFEKINNKFSVSISRNRSDFIRKILLDKPVTVKLRNQSLDDFMKEVIVLRNELNAIGNNYNQAVKKLNALQHIDEVKFWLIRNEPVMKILLEKVTEIKTKIFQLNDQWLQS